MSDHMVWAVAAVITVGACALMVLWVIPALTAADGEDPDQVVTAADAATQLVQLGQAEFVGALDDDGVGARHVDAGLDDGRGDQHVEALVVEVAHHLFQLAFAELAVTDADARLGHQFGQIGGALLDGLHIVV